MEADKKETQAWASWDNPVLTPAQWQEVRRACEAGLSYQEASERWKIDAATVRKRAQREEWITSTRIKIMAEKLAEKEEQEKAELIKSRQVTQVEKRPETAIEAVAETLESHRSQTLLGLAKTLRNAINSPQAQSILPENVSELVQLGGLALKLYGVEGNNGVQVNIVTDGQAHFQPGDFPVVDVDD